MVSVHDNGQRLSVDFECHHVYLGHFKKTYDGLAEDHETFSTGLSLLQTKIFLETRNSRIPFRGKLLIIWIKC